MSGTTVALPATTTTTTNREAIDEGNPQTIADHLRNIKLGSVLRGLLPQVLRLMVPATLADSPSGTAVQTIQLAKHGKASRITRAYARTGTTTGELTPDAGAYAAPASGHIAIQPNGDIAVLTSDAITSLDVAYEPEFGDVIVLPPLPVVSNSMTLPTSALATGGAVLLLNAVSLVGTTTGVMRVNKPAATNSTSGTASLDVAKTHVLFSSATDAVTSAQVTLLIVSQADLTSYLSAQAALL